MSSKDSLYTDSQTLAQDHFKWNFVGNTKNFLTCPKSGQPTFIGDFSGLGKDEVLFYNPGDKAWWLGQLTETNQYVYQPCGTASPFCGFGSDSLTYIADFAGSGTASVLTFDAANQHWMLGQLVSQNAIRFANVATTTNFLTTPGTGQPTFVADFSGLGQQQVLFYNPGDTAWWLGTLNSSCQLTFSSLGTVAPFKTYKCSSLTFIGDFSGSGQAEVLTFDDGEYMWWLGQISAQGAISFTKVGTTRYFLSSPTTGQPTFIGDFSGCGQTQLFFNNPPDQTWWLGTLNDSAEFSFSQVAQAEPFSGYGQASRTYIDDFSGQGRSEVLAFDSTNQHWHLGQISGGKFSFSLVAFPNYLIDPPNGPPTFIGDFQGIGRKDLLLYDPGDNQWWMGAMNQPLKMLMLASGSLSVTYQDEYAVQGSDFTVSAMVQPSTSSGTILSAGAFELSIGSNGAISFSVYRSSPHDSHSQLSAATNIVNSPQCHIITCMAPLGWAPQIWLDGEQLSTTSQTVGTAPAANQNLLLGNNAAGNSQYAGGLMNISLWNRILSNREPAMAGYGRISEIGVGPVGFWKLDNSLNDISAFDNDLQAGSASFSYMPCLNCITLYGPNSYSYCEIEGNYQYGPVTTITSSQTMQVTSDVVSLVANIVDNSGYAHYPEGVFVQVTDPSGKVYNHNENPEDGSLFVATVPVDGHNTLSLFSLIANNPAQGTWKVTVKAPSNVIFKFRMQALPARHLISSSLEAFKGFDRHRRALEVQAFPIFAAIIVVEIAVLIATDKFEDKARNKMIRSANLDVAPVNAKTAISDVNIQELQNDAHSIKTSIENALTAAHSDLKGTFWDTGTGSLPSGWMLQCGTKEEAEATLKTFHDLVNSTTKCVDFLCFGSIAGEFLANLKTFISKTKLNITIRIYMGNSATVKLSKDSRHNTYVCVPNDSDLVDEAYNAYTSLYAKDSPVNLFVAAGCAYQSILSGWVNIPSGWNHDKIMIVNGEKAVIGGMNFWSDSSGTPADPSDAVNDISALVSGGTAKNIQDYVNAFWVDISSRTLTRKSDYPPYQAPNNLSGACYSPTNKDGTAQSFAVVSSATYSNLASEVSSLNSNIFNSAASGGSTEIINVSRRSGYKFSQSEPSDLAIIELIKKAKTSIYISQQAMCYPTATSVFLWDKAVFEIRQALKRNVEVNIVLSRPPKKGENPGFTGGYFSAAADKVRARILDGIPPDQVKLNVRNYPAYNHAKVVIVDKEAFYMGSHNIYPTKFQFFNRKKAINTFNSILLNHHSPQVVAAATILMCINGLFPEDFLQISYEGALGESGIIVCDSTVTFNLVTSYWDVKWANSST